MPAAVTPSDRVVTLPNALSVLRLVGVPFFFWLVLALVVRDLMLTACVPTLRRLGYGPALPVHYLGKAATFNLLYAFPFLLLADGSGDLTTTQTLASVFGWAFVVWGVTLYWWAGIIYVVQVRGLASAHRSGFAPRAARA